MFPTSSHSRFCPATFKNLPSKIKFPIILKKMVFLNIVPWIFEHVIPLKITITIHRKIYKTRPGLVKKSHKFCACIITSVRRFNLSSFWGFFFCGLRLIIFIWFFRWTGFTCSKLVFLEFWMDEQEQIPRYNERAYCGGWGHFSHSMER